MFISRTRLWWSTAGLLAFISVIGLFARQLGWYHEYWFTDVILHTLSGAMFALFWLGLSFEEKYKSKIVFFLTLAMAGVFGSYFWEVWEFGGIYILPEVAIAYIPNLSDSLSDIACGMLGALIIALTYWPRVSNR
ncbi:MAG TPA: hypothetical protein VM103_00030 [Candidatus Paceibacterota bacterium]|nr:hypothetical protein [Candidatus Paceibacterota bacterium]